MWLYNEIKEAVVKASHPTKASLELSPLFLVLFFIFISTAYAMNYSDEYLYMQDWQLPEAAQDMAELSEIDDLLYSGEIPFSGWAYEYGESFALICAISYKEGKKDGVGLFWYPDGKPMMNAQYRQGAPHGRFLGWYPDGKTIYDMILNNGRFASDLLLDDDQSRLQSEGEIYEQEGSDNDSIRE